jgi:hypothetical protein
MIEEHKLNDEVSELYAELARTAGHDPNDTDVRFARRCLVWCLRWRLASMSEDPHRQFII